MVTPAQSSQSIQTSIPPASPAKDANFSRIAAIAISLIVALASFLLLSTEVAIVITAVVTIVSVAYAMRAEKQPLQPASAIEPNTVAPDPSRPQEIIFMSAKCNETADINKAEYMTVIFKTKETAERFIANHHTKLFACGGYGYSVQAPTRVDIYSKNKSIQAVDILKTIYGHEGAVSLLCPISFGHYTEISSRIGFLGGFKAPQID